MKGREFLFRGKSRNGKWHEGDLLRVRINEEGYDPIDDYFCVEYVDDNDCVGFVLRDLQTAGMPYGSMFDQRFFTAYVEVIGNRWDTTAEELSRLLKNRKSAGVTGNA